MCVLRNGFISARLEDGHGEVNGMTSRETISPVVSGGVVLSVA